MPVTDSFGFRFVRREPVPPIPRAKGCALLIAASRHEMRMLGAKCLLSVARSSRDRENGLRIRCCAKLFAQITMHLKGEE